MPVPRGTCHTGLLCFRQHSQTRISAKRTFFVACIFLLISASLLGPEVVRALIADGCLPIFPVAQEVDVRISPSGAGVSEAGQHLHRQGEPARQQEAQLPGVPQQAAPAAGRCGPGAVGFRV